MLIIFGIRGRLHALGTGTFFCPRCGAERAYTQRGVRRWFTLFFLPIFPVSSMTAVGVRCDTCQGLFRDEVLALPTPQERRADAARALRQCVAAVLRSGDASSALARACALSTLNEALGEGAIGPDDLDADVARADPDQLAVYASPVAGRADPREAEAFFTACARVARCDGPLSDAERTALARLGESLSLSAATQLGVLELLAAPIEHPAQPGSP